ncbi:hypothetical protein [Chitinophaga agrisoli]|uniref:hypothetical protein n=1 Tax=Chitinophaga agrisoli TaxID=2607653 RepID=UPI001BC913AD|nr:hypothetical protein [Chitinophaga agrisoli]
MVLRRGIKWIAIIYIIFSGIAIFLKPLPALIGLDSFAHIYNYTTKNNEFQYSETVGKDHLSDMRRQYQSFLTEHKIPDTTLYRDFTPQYWKLWRWPEYYTRIKQFPPLPK